jgi:hypothetical protein
MFRMWKVKKYSNAKEWKHIAHHYRERAAQGRPTFVQIDGVPISKAKLRKKIALYGFQTTLERENAKLSKLLSSQRYRYSSWSLLYYAHCEQAVVLDRYSVCVG